MFSFNRLGQKFRKGIGLGQKFLKSAGSMGQKLASGFESAYNAASGFPIVGHAIKSSPLIQGLRGVVGGVGTLGKIASTAGQVLEKGSYDQKTAHKLYDTGKKFAAQAKTTGKEATHLFNKGDKHTNSGLTHHG